MEMDEASYQMQLQLQMQLQQQQQQQFSYYNNQSSYSNNPQLNQYNMAVYSNISNSNSLNYVNKHHDKTSNGASTSLPPPPLPPPPPPLSRPAPPPPPMTQYPSQQYFQYAQPNFENYSFQNMINQQTHNTINNYTNYPVASSNTTEQANVLNSSNTNNNFVYANNTNVNQNIYQNYGDSNNTSSSNNKSLSNNTTSDHVQYSPIKKTHHSPNKSNTLKNIDVAELKKYIRKMSKEVHNKQKKDELNSSISDNLSQLVNSAGSNRSSLAIPKYMKPKICKSPVIIHVVSSRKVVKPKAQLAVTPPSQTSEKTTQEQTSSTPKPAPPPSFNSSTSRNNIELYQNFENLKKENYSTGRITPSGNSYQTLPPPPPPQRPTALPPPPPREPPPPPFSLSSSILRPPKTNPDQGFPNNSLPPPPPPPVPAPVRNLPPPGQRPISPPNIPPPIQRNTHQFSKLSGRSTINNSLLNSLLNSSLNQSEHSQRKPENFDNSFNNSFNNSIGSNSTHNNSMFNNSATVANGSFLSNNNANYQAMLISPNLKTLYDKKAPPPPYPGKIEQPELKMDTAEIENDATNGYCNNAVNSSTSSSIQSRSSVRYCSPQAYKFYMEQHAENILKNHKAREIRCLQLENEMTKVDLPDSLKDQMRKLLRQKETNYLRLRRAKMNKSMFEHIKVLGLGAFGQVDLVRKRDDMQRLYAMKILHKSDIFNRNQAAHVKAERDILAEADNEWVVKLYYSFQDEENLYFVMDYVPGGDLMNLLIKLQIFSEELSKFYIGELTCAIESVHNLGFIHRDIKPDNILIDKRGHIKLTDFGLCTGFHWTHNSKYYQTEDAYNRLLEQKLASGNNTTNTSGKTNNKRLMAHSLVGTPNYIAPEILSRKGYTKSCDWWSVGVILYEMLVGEPPFRDETVLGTQSKVINWKQSLKIPDECGLSSQAKDLIFKLCTDAENRLGSNGIKAHEFFKNFDFGASLRIKEAPYVPTLKHPTDTSNFEPVDNIALADRKARLNCMNSPRFSPYNVNQRGAAFSEDEKNNYSNNSMLYEFTFRRFFDEAHSSENVLRSNENDSTSFSQFFQSITNENEQPKIDEKKVNAPLSPSLTSMMANVTTSSHILADSKSNKPEIKGAQTTCDIINDFLETTNQEIAEENLNSFKSIFNKQNNSSNQIFKPTSSNIQQPANQNSYFNKLANSNSGNNLNLNDLKENRNDDNQAPIFV